MQRDRAITPGGSPRNPRGLPANMAERLIVALDVPSIAEAALLVAKLDGTVSFFKIGLWLAFAEGVDGLLADLARRGKKLFLDTKMFDIGRTVEQGVARAADRGVSFVTVHGDRQIIEAAVKGRRGRPIKVFSVTVLTSLNDRDLRDMGYRLSVRELVHLRATQAVEQGCDGIIAAAGDDPDAIRRVAGSEAMLIATPGIRSGGQQTDDHQRSAGPSDAIERGADYLVVGRPISASPDPRAAAERMIREMERGDQLRRVRQARADEPPAGG